MNFKNADTTNYEFYLYHPASLFNEIEEGQVSECTCRECKAIERSRKVSDTIEWGKLSSRERDATVAERVMGLCGHWELEKLHGAASGFQCTKCKATFCVGTIEFDIPRSRPYTTSIAAAWEVVEKLPEGWKWILTNYGDGCSFLIFKPDMYVDIGAEDFEGSSPSTPEAICIAGLRAKGYEVQT